MDTRMQEAKDKLTLNLYRSSGLEETAEKKGKMSGTKAMLLNAAKKGDFKSLKTIMEEHKDMDLDCTDEMGKTVLHYAANAGQADIVQMIVQRILTLDTTDKTGKGAIHYAAKQGYVDILTLLVVSGAKVDFPDKQTGKTALHYAVKNNQFIAAEFLVYSGASQKVEDNDKRKPSDNCRSEQMRMILNTAQNATGEDNVTKILLEKNEIHEGSKTTLKNIELVVEYNNDGKGDFFTMICRRTTTENSGIDFGFREKEEVASDVFMYRVSRNMDSIPSILTVPLFSGPEKKQEVVIKTNEGNECVATDVEENMTKWTCKVKADLKTFSAFVAVCRPKRETFEVGTEATTVHSAVDERVEISIPENAFEEPTKVTIEITEPQDMLETGTEDIKDIISATSFYSINTEGGNPTKSINFKVPLPNNYCGVGSLLILSMDKNEEEQEEDENSWSILDQEVKVINNMIVFDVASFSVKVGIESFSGKNNGNDIKRQISHLYRKSRRIEHYVIFLTLIKRIGTTNVWKLAVECCHKDNAVERQKYWENEGYENKESKLKDNIAAISKQKYRVKPNEFIRVVGTTEDLSLEFHPKRDNFQHCMIQINAEKDFVIGGLEIIQLPSRHVSARGHEKPDVEKLLTSFELKLDWMLPKQSTPPPKFETGSSDEFETGSSDGSPDDFLNDSYMKDLMSELEYKDEWFPVMILMGISFSEVEKVLTTQENLSSMLISLALNWRDKTKGQEHLGVPVIVSALAKGGAFALSTKLCGDLKKWYDKQKIHDDVFSKWLKKAYMDINLLNPLDYHRPMSESYLAIISAHLEPSFETAQMLQLTKEEHTEVLACKTYINNHLKAMKLLVIFRMKSPSLIEGLDNLIQVLEALNKSEPRKWAIMCARSWVKRTADPVDPFRTQVDELMKKLN